MILHAEYAFNAFSAKSHNSFLACDKYKCTIILFGETFWNSVLKQPHTFPRTIDTCVNGKFYTMLQRTDNITFDVLSLGCELCSIFCDYLVCRINQIKICPDVITSMGSHVMATKNSTRLNTSKGRLLLHSPLAPIGRWENRSVPLNWADCSTRLFLRARRCLRAALD